MLLGGPGLRVSPPPFGQLHSPVLGAGARLGLICHAAPLGFSLVASRLGFHTGTLARGGGGEGSEAVSSREKRDDSLRRLEK